MLYLANIMYADGSEAKSFKFKKDAEKWLDEKNNNFEYETRIDILDATGNYVDSYIYTAKKE